MCRLGVGLSLVFALALLGGNSSDIKNLRQVNEHIYGGAQPTKAGFEALKKMGIKTVIELRDSPSQSIAEKQLVESLGMKYLSVPMSMHGPTDDQMKRVLSLLESSADWPDYVHCLGGKDRTGAVIACYRISHDGWNNRKALAEAEVHGLGAMDVGLKRYISRYKATSNEGSIK